MTTSKENRRTELQQHFATEPDATTDLYELSATEEPLLGKLRADYERAVAYDVYDLVELIGF